VFDRMDKVAGGGMPVADLREAMAALGVNMTRREVIRAIAEIKDQVRSRPARPAPHRPAR
jgi:Ca2+-binding EF-hand superfamily protein